MTTVYLVMCQRLGGADIAGIFSTEEEAKEHAGRLEASPGHCPESHYHTIVAWSLDGPRPVSADESEDVEVRIYLG